jgi:hypothetical protein
MSIALWLAAIFLVWLLFALRIGRRHDASMEDFPDRGESE